MANHHVIGKCGVWWRIILGRRYALLGALLNYREVVRLFKAWRRQVDGWFLDSSVVHAAAWFGFDSVFDFLGGCRCAGVILRELAWGSPDRPVGLSHRGVSHAVVQLICHQNGLSRN